MSDRKSRIGTSGAWRRAGAEGAGIEIAPSLPRFEASIKNDALKEQKEVPEKSIEELKKEMDVTRFDFSHLIFQQENNFFRRSYTGSRLRELRNKNSMYSILWGGDKYEQIAYLRAEPLARKNDGLYRERKRLEELFTRSEDIEEAREYERMLVRIQALLRVYQRGVEAFEKEVDEEVEQRERMREEREAREKKEQEESLEGRIEKVMQKLWAATFAAEDCASRLSYNRVKGMITSDHMQDEAEEFRKKFREMYDRVESFIDAQKAKGLRDQGDSASLQREIEDARVFVNSTGKEEAEQLLTKITQKKTLLEERFTIFQERVKRLAQVSDQYAGNFRYRGDEGYTPYENVSTKHIVARMPSEFPGGSRGRGKEILQWEKDQQHRDDNVQANEVKKKIEDAAFEFSFFAHDGRKKNLRSPEDFRKLVEEFITTHAYGNDFDPRGMQELRERLMSGGQVYLAQASRKEGQERYPDSGYDVED